MPFPLIYAPGGVLMTLGYSLTATWDLIEIIGFVRKVSGRHKAELFSLSIKSGVRFPR